MKYFHFFLLMSVLVLRFHFNAQGAGSIFLNYSKTQLTKSFQLLRRGGFLKH